MYRALLRCGALAGLIAALPAVAVQRVLNVHSRRKQTSTQKRGSQGYARQPVHTWDAEQVGVFLDTIEGHRRRPLYHLTAYQTMVGGKS